MQTQDLKNPQYKNIVHCAKSIIVKDSFGGLYRGMSSPMLGSIACNAVAYGVYAGAMAGAATSIITSPMELAKTRLQVQMDKKWIGATKFKGPIQCMLYIYQCGGIRAIFQGWSATVLRDIPGFSIYFVSYEFLMRQKNDPGVAYTLFAGGSAGSMSWIFAIPIDVIKTRLQVDGMSDNHKRMYNGLADCWKQSYKAEGTAFMTLGLSSTLLRAFPMSAVAFLVVEIILKYWNKHLESKVDQSHSIIK